MSAVTWRLAEGGPIKHTPTHIQTHTYRLARTTVFTRAGERTFTPETTVRLTKIPCIISSSLEVNAHAT